MKRPTIPLSIGVVIVSTIALLFLTGPLVSVVVAVVSGAIVLGTDRLTANRLDGRVMGPALVGGAIAGLLAVNQYRHLHSLGSSLTIAGLILLAMLGAVATTAMVAVVLRRSRNLRTWLLLGAAVAEVAAALTFTIEYSTLALISAVVLSAAGVAAYDDTPRITRVPDIAPPGFWRHL